jgi:Tol biopolymer transport system component
MHLMNPARPTRPIARWIALTLVLSLLLAPTACRSTREPVDAEPDVPKQEQVATPRQDVLASATGKIAAADVPADTGGAIVLQDKITVAFPPRGLRADRQVLLRERDSAPQADPGTLYLPGSIYEIETAQEVFERPIEITLHYDEDALPAGITEEEVFAVFLHEGAWRRAYGQVDTRANTITVRVVHASIWTWGVDKLSNVIGMAESLFGVADVKEAPVTLEEARALVEERRDAFYEAVDAFELTEAELSGGLSEHAEDEALKLTLHYVADKLLEQAATKAAGKKLVAVKLGQAVVGFIGLVDGGMTLFRTATTSGEVIAEMVKVERAYDALCEAEARVWLLERPDAMTMPPELAASMRRTAPEETAPHADLPDLPTPADTLPNVSAPGLPAPPAGASRILFSSRPEDGSTRSPEIYVMNADGSGRTRLTTNNATDIEPALSPDGTRIAFVSDRDGNYEIYTMRVDGADLRRLTHDDKVDPVTRDWQPDWSPDGARIAFASMRTGSYDIYVMNADGSGVANLTNSPRANDGQPDWSPDGTRIAFVSVANRGENLDVYVMNADGSGATNLTGRPGAPDLSPRWSPDGSRIAFVARIGSEYEIHTMAPDGSDPRRVLNEADAGLNAISSPTWSPDGAHIAFAGYAGDEQDIYVVDAAGMVMENITDNAVYDDEPSWGLAASSLPPSGSATATPAPEEPKAPAPTATPAPTRTPTRKPAAAPTATSTPRPSAPPSPRARIAFVSLRDGDATELYVMDADGANVTRLTDNDLGESQLDWSSDGAALAVYAHGGPGARSGLWVVRADGTERRDLGVVGAAPSWSPDGKTILYYNRDFALSVINADGTNERLFTDMNLGPSFYPSWSPDGSRIAFLAERSSANKNAYALDADGTHLVPLHVKEARDAPPIWSPDSARVAFHSFINRRWDIYVVNADGTERNNLTADQAGESSDPDWSPDGRHIAYAFKADGIQAIHVMDAQGRNKREVISTAGRSWKRVATPRWSPDGQQILFGVLDSSGWNVWVVNADGAGLQQLTDSPKDDMMAVWQPVPGLGVQPPPPEPATSHPIVGRWTWRNDYNQVWYIYRFFADGRLEITTEADANYLTSGAYRLVDENTIGLTYAESTEYLSSPGVESTWSFLIAPQRVEYQGKTQNQTVLTLSSRMDDLLFIRLD